jgi:RimJ/RimL family protein N-acetyltransferase
METYHFLQLPAPDLLNLTIEGERIQLVSLSDQYDQDIFREFTPAVTRYMFPKPAEQIGETRDFIQRSRRSMQVGNNLVVVIALKETGEFLGVCGLHGEESVTKPELGIWL